jgi:hypothetical protein
LNKKGLKDKGKDQRKTPVWQGSKFVSKKNKESKEKKLLEASRYQI